METNCAMIAMSQMAKKVTYREEACSSPCGKAGKASFKSRTNMAVVTNDTLRSIAKARIAAQLKSARTEEP